MNMNIQVFHYTCIAHQQSLDPPTILAEFNSLDSSLQTLAHQCLNQTPPNHSFFSHTHLTKTFTFLFDHPFIFFGIFDSKVSKFDQIQLLGRLKDTLYCILKHNVSDHFTSHCFQCEFDPVFDNLVSKRFDFDDTHLVTNGVETPPPPPPLVSGSSKGKKVLSLKIGKGNKKKWFGEDGRSESRDALVDGDIDSLGEFKSREVACRNGVCLIDGGGKLKANKKIWRRHVWIVLVLDLAVCLILFGIWLFVCQGFQCIEG